MAFPSQPGGGMLQNQQVTTQQLANLLSLLAKQPQANPTSTQFDPNYFSQLYSMQNQVVPQVMQQTVQSQQPAPVKQQPTCAYQVVKTVEDPSTIQPQEVVMGFSNLFPSIDGDKIFMKTWNNEGSIETRIYVEVKDGSKPIPKKKIQTTDQSIQSQFELFSNKILARMAEFELALEKLQHQHSSTSRSKPKSKSKTKSDGLLNPESPPPAWVQEPEEILGTKYEELVQIPDEEENTYE